MSRTRRVLLLVTALLAPMGLRAQSSCVGVAPTGARWSAPLDRVVVPASGERQLRDAIEELAASARVHLTYASDLVPARTVCLAPGPVRLGDVLVHWLGASSVRPVVVGVDRVVLVPGRLSLVSPVPVPPGGDLARSSAQLAPVLVRDSVAQEANRLATVSRTVITSDQLVASGATSISQALSGGVPGLWMWTPSPTSLGAGMASLRGASSFGASYPKVYVDGIEVANPLFLGQLTPEQVASIEVIRGPQGSALFGAGAINGVLNITTRQSAPGSAGASGMSMRSTAGIAESAFSPLGAFVQEHAFSGEFGHASRRLGIGATTATTGAFIPGAFNQQVQAAAGYSTLGRSHRLQFSARLLAQRAGNPQSPLLTEAQALAGPVPVGAIVDTGAAQSMQQYTVGGTLAVQRARWVHTWIAGADGYRLDNVSGVAPALRTPTDSALLASAGAGDRLSARWSAVTRGGDAATVATTFTLGADHSSLRDASRGATPPGGMATGALWRHTTGVSAHAEVSVQRALVFTAGLRAERNAGFTVVSGENLLPTLGAAYRRALGDVALLTLRGAWGKAIQPPRVGAVSLQSGGRLPNVFVLEPETQSGFEWGADLKVGAGTSLSVTRYDQVASDLIQPVTFTLGPRGRAGVAQRLENIGAIANRGWELEGRQVIGRLTLTGALGLSDSRVRAVANNYTGELRVGDRALQVPARTMSLGASWLGQGWTTSMTVARASDWVNYDWLGLSMQPQASGAELRDFWMTYTGVTRVRAALSRDITRSFGVVISGDNLLGTQRGEPDNLTVVPGRTVRAGLRARFM